MGRSPIVVFNRETIKSVHDQLVRAWEESDSITFDEALAAIATTVDAVPRKKYGSRKVYENDAGEQPAWMAVKDPAALDIECID